MLNCKFTNQYELVHNESKYFEFIRLMRTNKDNINGFIEQVQITPEQQESYMKKYCNFYYICLLKDEPVGFVGVIDDDIRIAVKPEMKQKGVAKFMVNQILTIYPNAIAKIKINNFASKKLFESCGFKTSYIIMKK